MSPGNFSLMGQVDSERESSRTVIVHTSTMKEVVLHLSVDKKMRIIQQKAANSVPGRGQSINKGTEV